MKLNNIKNTKLISFILLVIIAISTTFIFAKSKRVVLIVEEEVRLDVAEKYELEFMPYITEEIKSTLNWDFSSDEFVYFIEETESIYALKAGTTTVKVSNDDFESSFDLVVNKVNLYEQGDFEHFSSSDKWDVKDKTVNNWRIYSGGAEISSFQKVGIDTVTRDGVQTKTIHANHEEIAYSTIYYDIPVSEAGYYYAEADMKGENISNQKVFIRVNVNTPTANQTQGMDGTFDWQRFQSDLAYVDSSKKTLRVELYGANYKGKVWYDNVGVYKAVNKEYFSYDLNTNLVDLELNGTEQINPTVNIDSPINFHFFYDTLDHSVATVDKNGLVKAVGYGVTELVVVDKELGIEKRVHIIVGDQTNLTIDETNITVDEDSTTEIVLDYSGNTKGVTIYKYLNPENGKFYIKNNNTIVYSPNKDFNSDRLYREDGPIVDSFRVILYEEDSGFIYADVNVHVNAKKDPIRFVEFWQSVDKEGILEDGYVQVISRDIESEIPEQKHAEMNTNNVYNLKKQAYETVVVTLANGNLSGTSKYGGTINIKHDGKAQEIKDRYYSAQNKLIYGMTYEYEPANDFFGYDEFDVKVDNGEHVTEFTVKVYVKPDEGDFRFDDVDFSGFYVLGNDEWVSETRAAYGKDPYITKWIDEYEEQFKVFKPIGVPAKARSSMEMLGILYQVTGEMHYAEKAWLQLNEVTKDNTFPGGDGTKRLSWGGASNGFLDAAMATYSFAVGYNMIYETLTIEQRTQVIRALYEEGFYFYETLNNPNVLLHGNNHNLLVNGNLAIAALSAMSFEGDITVTIGGQTKDINVKQTAANIVTLAYEYFQVGLVHYSKSGGFPEGPGYNYYAHRNVIALLATLKNVYGGDSFNDLYDFGLTSIEGIVNYPEYTLYTSAPNMDSFYYNEGSGGLNQPGLLWYSRMDDKYLPYTLINKKLADNDEKNVLSLLWYKPYSFESLDISTVNPLDKKLDVHEIASFRSSFADEFGVFAALKGFNPTTNLFTHKSLDSGTFELVAFGEKFIENFSDENYSLSVPPGFWDYDTGRWQYYKKQPQGHNTLVFNPIDNPMLQQDPYEFAAIEKFVTGNDGGYGVVNLSDVYKDNVLDYNRGLKLDENRQVVTVQDEFKLRKESEVYWSAHTLANIEIINDKLAALSLNGKKVYVKINSELGSFQKMGAVPLPGTVGKYHNLKNEGVNKLVIYENNLIEGTISVSFIPTLDHIDESNLIREVEAINEWNISDDNLSNITAENISFEAETGDGYRYIFDKNRYSYLVKLSSSEQFTPLLNVEYDLEKYDLNIEYGRSLGKTTKVILTDKTTKKSRTYTFKFVVDIFVDGFDDFKLHENITATSNVANPGNLVDDNRSTLWYAKDREEAIFDLGDQTRVTNISIRFGSGIINNYYFDIYAGNSLDEMEPVYFGGVSTKKIGDEFYTIGDVNARYFKIVFSGNNEDYETSVSRVNFYDNLLEAPIYGNDNDGKDAKKLKPIHIVLISVSSVILLGGAGFATWYIIKRKKVK